MGRYGRWPAWRISCTGARLAASARTRTTSGTVRRWRLSFRFHINGVLDSADTVAEWIREDIEEDLAQPASVVTDSRSPASSNKSS